MLRAIVGTRWGNAAVRWFLGAQHLGILWTGRVPSQFLRRLLYRRLWGVQLAADAVVYGGAEIRRPSALSIGAGTAIGHGAVLDARAGLTIGQNVNLSSGVWIWTVQHDYRSRDFSTEARPVVIKDFAWVSCRATILPGVTIGEGAVVAAGAVVAKDVADYEVVAGVPAVRKGTRPRDLCYRPAEGFLPFI